MVSAFILSSCTCTSLTVWSPACRELRGRSWCARRDREERAGRADRGEIGRGGACFSFSRSSFLRCLRVSTCRQIGGRRGGAAGQLRCICGAAAVGGDAVEMQGRCGADAGRSRAARLLRLLEREHLVLLVHLLRRVLREHLEAPSGEGEVRSGQSWGRWRRPGAKGLGAGGEVRSVPSSCLPSG